MHKFNQRPLDYVLARIYGWPQSRRHDDPPEPSWLVLVVVVAIAVLAALNRLLGG